MPFITVEILNPKAEKLLKDLVELNLITISGKSVNPFLKAVKKIRAQKAALSLEEITKEVELVRSKRYGK